MNRRHDRRAAPRGAAPAGSPAPHLHLVRRNPAGDLDARLRRRDPAFIRRVAPILAWMTDVWFRAEVEGTRNLSAGPALMVSTHNGSLHTPDLYTLMVAFWRRFGVETPGYGLMHRLAFRLPLLGRFLERLGALPAEPENGRVALRAGHPVLVCPGGDVDALKPWRNRHVVDFGQRRGFVRLAIEEQVPIVPIVSVGAHETVFVVTDGQALARRVPFARRLRLKSVPLAVGFPFGLTPAGVGNIPLPTKVRQRILPPIRIDAPREAAEDPAFVDQWFRRIQSIMQTAVDELAAERRWPVLG